MLLRRFDDLAAAVANFGAARGEDRGVPLAGLPARDALARQLKDRGVPSSTIRQVEAALDESEQEAARRNSREYKRKHGNACVAMTCRRNVVTLYTQVYKESECRRGVTSAL